MIKYKGPKVADYGTLLARPHYEAVIADLATLYGWEPHKLRSLIKRKLKIFKIIQKSTTELTEIELKDLANKFSAFYFLQTETPDRPLNELNINKILSI